MDIQNYINSYIDWLKSEISFKKIGEYYEINTPFLDNDNDYLQFYVKQDGDELYFTDDGYTINSLEMTGFNMTPNRKKQLSFIVSQYGVQVYGKDLILKAPSSEFPQKKHAFTQCLIRVSDMYMTSRNKASTYFLDDIQAHFQSHDIYCLDNVQFTGKSGFTHNYDFGIPPSKSKPERLCLAINNPTRTAMGNAIFAWNDTKPARKNGSNLIVILNDFNKISKGVEDGFASYDVSTIRWSERNNQKNIDILTA